MQKVCFQVDLVPAQRDKLLDSEPMTIGQEEEGATARPVSAAGLQNFVDFVRRQILTLAPRGT
jgi:hypothetical protein